MIRELKAVVFAAVSVLASAMAAAETCGPEKIAGTVVAYRQVATPSTPSPEFFSSKREIDAAAANCPETAWIRIIAAGAEIKALERFDASVAGKVQSLTDKNEAFAHVERAAAHVLAFRDNFPEEFSHSGVRLAYKEWSGLMEPVIHALLRHADEGRVHPLASDNPPRLECDYVSSAMATNASNFRFAHSPSSLRLLTSIADACRLSDDRTDWSVLSQRASKLIRQVSDGVITEPARIQWALREAYRDSRRYLDDKKPPFGLWSESQEASLQKMLEKHKTDLSFIGEYTEIPQTDWFQPEHLDTEDLVYSIALAISRNWTPLAAGGTEAEISEATAARGAFARYVSGLARQADDADHAVTGRRAISEALTAFQKGFVRTPETANLPGAPNWLYEVMQKTLTGKIVEMEDPLP